MVEVLPSFLAEKILMRVVTSLCDHGGSRALHTPSKMLHLAEPAPAKVGLAWSLHRFKQSNLEIL